MNQEPIHLIDLKADYHEHKKEIDDAINRVLASGQFTLGKETQAFEEAWASYCGRKYCVTVSNGTDGLALTISAKCLLKNIDSCFTVGMTALTFSATARAVTLNGANPIFFDVDSSHLMPHWDDYCDYILPVDIYGLRHTITCERPIICWDACQSHGLPAPPCPTIYSFYPAKTLGAYGDAGAIVTDDEDMATLLRELRHCGKGSANPNVRYDARNARMDEIQAAILNAKLRHLPSFVTRRKVICEQYLESISRPSFWSQDAPYLYVLLLDTQRERNGLKNDLEENNIYPQIHYSEPTPQQAGINETSYPNAEEICTRVLSLPLYPQMTKQQIKRVIETVNKSLEDNWDQNHTN